MHKWSKAYQLDVSIRKPTDYHAFHQERNNVSNQLDTAKRRLIGKKLDEAPDVRSKWREFKKLELTKRRLLLPLMFIPAQVLNQHYASTSNSTWPLMEKDLHDIIVFLTLKPNFNLPTYFFWLCRS